MCGIYSTSNLAEVSEGFTFSNSSASENKYHSLDPASWHAIPNMTPNGVRDWLTSRSSVDPFLISDGTIMLQIRFENR